MTNHTSPRKREYISPDIRRAVFERDRYVCQICGNPTVTDSPLFFDWHPAVDHVIPHAAGGADDPHNLRTTHMKCNFVRGAGSKTDAQVAEEVRELFADTVGRSAHCVECSQRFPVPRTGRPKRFCGQTCRKRASRRPKFPSVMTGERRWVRAVGKRPVQVSGAPASSTDPGTWASFLDVQQGAGDGFGIMLGGGLGCYDFDHMSDLDVRGFVALIPEPVLFAERSVSGEGVHVFVVAPEERGWRRGSVERYTRARFIRVTGVIFDL